MVIDKEFLEKEWLQNCGDYVIVFKKSNKQDKWKEFLWEVNYKFCPLKENELRRKREVVNGKCYNKNIPLIKDINPLVNSEHFVGRVRLNKHLEAENFMQKIWPQKCGDSIKILRPIKIEKERYRHGIKSKIFIISYECQFINCPCENIIIANRDTIINGHVNNSKKEIEEFIGKRFKQKGGDYLTVLEKTNILDKHHHNFLWKVKFDHFDYICLAQKGSIIRGEVENKNIPWKNKNNFKKFLNNEVNKNDGKKLNSKEIYFKYFNWSVSRDYFLKKIKDYNFINYFDDLYIYIHEEDILRNYIKEIYKGKIETYWGKKEDNYYELDIYLPDLKIAFEYNGSYWHQEGKFKELGYHTKKFDFFLKKGIIIYNIWDWFWFIDYEYRYKYRKELIVREEAKIYIDNIINCYKKCLVNKF